MYMDVQTYIEDFDLESDNWFILKFIVFKRPWHMTHTHGI